MGVYTMVRDHTMTTDFIRKYYDETEVGIAHGLRDAPDAHDFYEFTGVLLERLEEVDRLRLELEALSGPSPARGTCRSIGQRLRKIIT